MKQTDWPADREKRQPEEIALYNGEKDPAAAATEILNRQGLAAAIRLDERLQSFTDLALLTPLKKNVNCPSQRTAPIEGASDLLVGGGSMGPRSHLPAHNSDPATETGEIFSIQDPFSESPSSVSVVTSSDA